MLTLLTSTLLLTTQCIGYGADGTIEEQFDQCLAGEWGEEGCTSGRTYSSAGYVNDDGETCTTDYLIRDPHTGGFRVFFVCGESETRGGDGGVWIVEDGQLKIGSEVSGFPTAAWRCEAED